MRLFALAVDRLMAAGPDTAGWRLHLRLADLRRVLEDAGLDLEPSGPPSPPTIRVPGPGTVEAPADSQPPAPHPQLLRLASATTSELSRARHLTRGIRHGRSRELAIRAVVQGAQLRMTSGGHVLLSGGPLSSPVSIGTTSSGDHARSWANLRADARRKGLDTEGL